MSKKEQQTEPLDIRRVIQYAFPMVFIILAFGFYLNGSIPVIMAWIFAAVGVMEYFLIGLIRMYQKPTATPRIHEA